MNLMKKVFSNTFYIFLDWASVALASLIFFTISGKFLLPEQLGIVLTSVNTAVLLSNISLIGFGNALPKLIPEYSSKKQFRKINELLFFSLKAVAITSLLISLFLFIFSSYIIEQLKITQQILFIIIFSLITISFSNLSSFIVYGFQKMRKLFLSDIFGAATKVIITLALLLLGLSYFGPLAGVLIGYLTALALRFDLKWIGSRTKLIDKKQMLLVYVLPAFIGVLSSVILSNAQYIILTVLKDPASTGKFGVAYTWTSQIYVISNILGSAIYPTLSQLGTDKKNKKKLNDLIGTVLRYLIFAIFPFTAFMIGFSKPIILLFSRPEYLQASGLFPILGIAFLLNAFCGIFVPSLYAIGQIKINRNIHIFNALIFLSISIPLTYMYSSTGLSLAFLITTLFSAVASYAFLRKSISISLPWKPLGKVVAATLIFLAMVHFADLLQISILFKIILVGFSAAIYPILLLFMRFYTKQDITTLKMISSYLPEGFRPIIKILIGILSKFV